MRVGLQGPLPTGHTPTSLEGGHPMPGQRPATTPPRSETVHETLPFRAKPGVRQANGQDRQRRTSLGRQMLEARMLDPEEDSRGAGSESGGNHGHDPAAYDAPEVFSSEAHDVLQFKAASRSEAREHWQALDMAKDRGEITALQRAVKRSEIERAFATLPESLVAPKPPAKVPLDAPDIPDKVPLNRADATRQPLSEAQPRNDPRPTPTERAPAQPVAPAVELDAPPRAEDEQFRRAMGLEPPRPGAPLFTHAAGSPPPGIVALRDPNSPAAKTYAEPLVALRMGYGPIKAHPAHANPTPEQLRADADVAAMLALRMGHPAERVIKDFDLEPQDHAMARRLEQEALREGVFPRPSTLNRMMGELGNVMHPRPHVSPLQLMQQASALEGNRTLHKDIGHFLSQHQKHVAEGSTKHKKEEKKWKRAKKFIDKGFSIADNVKY